MGEEGDDSRARRQRWKEGPGEAGWQRLPDDELLFRISSLPQDHTSDEFLLDVVRSDRHFFVRQEAAKRIRSQDLLKEHSGDRHIGQILVRGMNRDEDVAYLRKLMTESHHLEVRKAAEAQLRRITAKRDRR
jgi:hypothetical protein